MATSRKKGKGYEIRVSFGYDFQGHRIRKSEMWNPPPGMTTKQIEKELQREMYRFEEELKGGNVNDGTIKFVDFVEIWKQNYAKPRLARKTYHGYINILPRIIKALGHLKLCDITATHINQFYRNLAEPGISKRATRNENGVLVRDGKLSPTTILDYHKLLSGILSKGVRWQYIDRNPVSLANPPKPSDKEAVFLSVEETKRLILLLAGVSIQYRTIVLLLIFTGLRRGELLALQWQDIDFENRVIKVERSVQHFGRDDYHIKKPKTNSGKRSFAFSDFVFEVLTEYRAWQSELKESVGDIWTAMDEWVFTRENGMPVIPSTLTKWFRHFIDKNNLPKVCLHSLRHTNATLLIGNGADVATVSKRLGHANSSVTLDIYTHVLKPRDRDAADSLDEILSLNDEKCLKMADFEHLRGKMGGKEEKVAISG